MVRLVLGISFLVLASGGGWLAYRGGPSGCGQGVAPPVAFAVTGSCGPPGRVVVQVDSACGLELKSAPDLGLPASGRIGSRPLREGGWTLRGEARTFDARGCEGQGAVARDESSGRSPTCWYPGPATSRTCVVTQGGQGHNLVVSCLASPVRAASCVEWLAPVE